MPLSLQSLCHGLTSPRSHSYNPQGNQPPGADQPVEAGEPLLVDQPIEVGRSIEVGQPVEVGQPEAEQLIEGLEELKELKF